MYKWDVDEYSRSSSEQQKWALELIEKLNLKGDEHVLDIGSGDGKVTAEVARRVPRGFVLGVDSSESMVRFAKEKFSGVGYENLKFEVMDAHDLALEGGFDVVFSNATLHWVVDHMPVLKGIKKCLNPGGRILLQMGGKGNAAEVLLAAGRVTERDDWSRYFKNFAFPYGFYGPEEYRGWLVAAGLTPKRLELIDKDMVHNGRKGLSAWLRTTWLPYTQRVPEGSRSQFINEVAEEYLHEHPLDVQGFAHVKMVRLEVEASN